MDYKEHLEAALKYFKEMLETKQQNLKNSKLYTEELNKNRNLTMELMKLKDDQLELENSMLSNIPVTDEIIKLYSTEVKKINNDEDCVNELEKYLDQMLDFPELVKDKTEMNFDEFVKLKEDITKELFDIKIKDDSLEETFKTYIDDVQQQAVDYEDITNNIKDVICNLGNPNQLSLIVEKKKAYLKSLETQYNSIEADMKKVKSTDVEQQNSQN